MIRRLPARGPRQPKESGAAMLIAIFALLLISVVAIALVVSSGTDSSLAGNYRTASSAYYAGVAGLEEARGRLLWKNPDCIVNRPISPPNCPNVGFIPMDPITGVLPAMSLTQVRYILNPNPLTGETVDPTNPANPYADTEYQNEFGFSLSSAEIQTIASDSAVAGLPGPAYKWVRISPVTEKTLNVDVNGDGVIDNASVLFYDPAHVSTPSVQPSPSLIVPPGPAAPPVAPTPTAVQALEITALAVAPNGGKRLLQYVVAPLVISPDAADQNFPAALTLDGNGVTFAPPGTPGYEINGQNGVGCPSPPGPVPSVGVTNTADYNSLLTTMNQSSGSYPGAPVSGAPSCSPSTPSLTNANIGYPNSILRQSWLTPASLDAAMQDIENSADVVLNGAASSSDIQNAAPAMSAANPMTVVVNGNLRLNGNGFVGFGLLLVTGTLTYDSEASWNGIVLVVGQGALTASSFGSGNGGFNGTVFVAQTRDSSGNLLPGNNLGSACFGPRSACSSGGFGGGSHHGFGGGYGSNPGFGVSYNSTWVSNTHGPLTYKILSFHEIPLPN